MNNEYDISKAFQEIEETLIKSMKRNLGKHLQDETLENMNWSMWQAEQLKSLEQFKKDNKQLFSKDFSSINTDIEELIKKSYESGKLEQEKTILEAIKNGTFNSNNKQINKLWSIYNRTKNSRIKQKQLTRIYDIVNQTEASFFKVNERKLKALIEEATGNFKKVETSILRYSNDQYRKIIYNAQVYANTGAGTVKQAIDMATENFLAKGINSIEYSNGAMVNIASYAEMAIRTANKRAQLQGEGAKRQEWGVHTVLVPNRGGGCPYCIKYQGKIFIDDVWSGGTSEESKKTGYPLLSTAVAGKLFHPNCKDTTVTYFEGVSTKPTPPTKQELQQKIENYKKEQKLKYIDRQIDKFRRLEDGSFDEENQKKYYQKRLAWQEYKKKFKENSNLSFKDFQKDSIIYASNKKILENLESSNIEYNQVYKLNKVLTDNEIINKIGGGDMTNGSCASVGLSYIANKNGLDVLDYRGGESQRFFSNRNNLYKISQLTGVKSVVEENYNDIIGTTKLLKTLEDEKEYFLVTGRHASIVRKINGKIQFLELQSSTQNGFKELTIDTLKQRFGCQQSWTIYGSKIQLKNILIEVDSLKNNTEFEKILGYMNTQKSKQLKGVSGNVK